MLSSNQAIQSMLRPGSNYFACVFYEINNDSLQDLFDNILLEIHISSLDRIVLSPTFEQIVRDSAHIFELILRWKNAAACRVARGSKHLFRY
ncbi:hypothetical protein ACOSQ3_030636 [Xanthoceras sorbifolium]